MLGNLVRFVEDVQAPRYTADGATMILKGRVAENIGGGNSRFFSFTAFARKGDDGKYHGPANRIFQFSGKKGQQILLVGSLNNNDYTNKDGQKVYGYDFNVSNCDLVGSASTPAAKTTTQPQAVAPQQEQQGFVPMPTDGMPFQFN